MKVIKQKHEIIADDNPMKHIEKIARVCYKSEDKICDGSDKKMIKSLYRNKHMAMFEHFIFIMEVKEMLYKSIEALKLDYFNMTHCNNRYLISCNARSLINMVEDSDAEHHNTMAIVVECIRKELIGHIVKYYDCYELFGMDRDNPPMLSTSINFVENSRTAMTAEEFVKHGWMSCKFTTDRGITHEIVRHRKASFAQESTRYCNYGNNKFGKEITVIDQGFSGAGRSYWCESIMHAESMYLELLNAGATPQLARSVLPTCVKAEIVVTASVEEWLHIFELRSCGFTGSPHPMMKELMDKLLSDVISDWYIKYNNDMNRLLIGGDWLYE